MGGWAAAALGGADVLGKIGSYFASANEARKARKWAERMMNTAYQRTMRDLEKAGLNPMLAISQGPTTGAPGAAMARPPEFTAGQGVASAAQLIGAEARSAKVDPEVGALVAQTEYTRERAQSERVQQRLMAHQIGETKERTRREHYQGSREQATGQEALQRVRLLMEDFPAAKARGDVWRGYGPARAKAEGVTDVLGRIFGNVNSARSAMRRR